MNIKISLSCECIRIFHIWLILVMYEMQLPAHVVVVLVCGVVKILGQSLSAIAHLVVGFFFLGIFPVEI